jgi:hypothetical protein
MDEYGHSGEENNSTDPTAAQSDSRGEKPSVRDLGRLLNYAPHITGTAFLGIYMWNVHFRHEVASLATALNCLLLGQAFTAGVMIGVSAFFPGIKRYIQGYSFFLLLAATSLIWISSTELIEAIGAEDTQTISTDLEKEFETIERCQHLPEAIVNGVDYLKEPDQSTEVELGDIQGNASRSCPTGAS